MSFIGKRKLSQAERQAIREIGYASIMQILGADLSAFWPFDEISGTTVNDWTVNGHDLTPSKDIATWDTKPKLAGLVNTLTFDGTDEYLSAGDDAEFTTAGAFSCGGWVNLVTPAGSSIITKWDETTDAQLREFSLWIGANGYPSFYLYDETNNAAVGRRDETVLSAGVWHFIVGVFDGGTDAANAKVYVDGVATDDADIADEAGFADLVDTDTVVGIGYQESTEGEPSVLCHGSMWGPFYVKKELTADDVWNLYRIGKGLLGA